MAISIDQIKNVITKYVEQQGGEEVSLRELSTYLEAVRLQVETRLEGKKSEAESLDLEDYLRTKGIVLQSACKTSNDPYYFRTEQADGHSKKLVIR